MMASARTSREPFEAVEKEGELLDALRLHGLHELAARLARLSAMIAADPDEPELVLDSLRSFADFFMHEDRLPVPEIGVDPEGLLEAEWRIPAKGGNMQAPAGRPWRAGDGILAMKFLSTGLVKFAATSESARLEEKRLRTSGILPKKDIMSAVQPLVSRLIIP